MSARTISVASCHSPAEAMMIQAVLRAHGIEAIIPGAGSASMTAAAVGFSSRVLVNADVAEDAAALIAELRSGAAGEAEADDEDELSDPDHEAASDEPDLGLALVRRHRIGVTVCLSLMLTFGAGHLFHRAYARGMALAGLEVLGIRYLWAGQRLGSVLVVGAVVLDLIGGVLQARRGAVTRRKPLPDARLLRSSKVK